MDELDQNYESEADQLIAEHSGDAVATIAKPVEERSLIRSRMH